MQYPSVCSVVVRLSSSNHTGAAYVCVRESKPVHVLGGLHTLSPLIYSDTDQSQASVRSSVRMRYAAMRCRMCNSSRNKGVIIGETMRDNVDEET